MALVAATVSATLSSGGRSSVTGSYLRGGSSRSMQMRSAAMFPCLARLIAVRAMLSPSRSSISCSAIVALLRDPRGRPAGFPLWPFSNGMA